MACYILTASGQVIVRRSVWAISDDQKNDPVVKEALQLLKESVHDKLKSLASAPGEMGVYDR